MLWRTSIQNSTFNKFFLLMITRLDLCLHWACPGGSNPKWVLAFWLIFSGSSHHKIFAFHGSHKKEVRFFRIRSRGNSSGSNQELIDRSHGSPEEIFGFDLAFLSIGTGSCRSDQEIMIDRSHGSPKEVGSAIFNGDELGGVGVHWTHVFFGFMGSIVSFISLIHCKIKINLKPWKI